MLPFGTRRPQKPSVLPSLMKKGLMVLRSVASRDPPAPELKPAGGPRALGRPAQALGPSRRRTSHFQQDACPEDVSFVLAMEELRGTFLRRPDCPQFCTRATSTSHLGSATAASPPEEVCVGSEARRMTEGSLFSQQGSDTQVDGHLVHFSKSACEISRLRKRSQFLTSGLVTGSPALAQSRLGKWAPWYIAVIHEKDRCLWALGEEVQRLSRLQEQVQRKDAEILALRRQLDVLRGEGQGPAVRQAEQDRPPTSVPWPQGKPRFLTAVCREGDEDEDEEEDLQLWKQEECALVDRGRELDAGGEEAASVEEVSSLQGEASVEEVSSLQGEASLEEVSSLQGAPSPQEAKRASDQDVQGPAGSEAAVPEEAAEEQEEEGGLEEEEEEEEEEEKGAQGSEYGSCRRAYSLGQSFEKELMAQLEECEQVIHEFQRELEATRTRHSLATGAILSLQRQLDVQESQLKKTNAENEALQKELRERRRQLQAMTDKFSNLREDKKLQEVMGLIETDNLVLREQVWELQQELTTQRHTVSEADAKVSQLQAQLSQSQKLLQTQKQLQEETQGKAEQVQQAELQARVILESTQSRLERLRNKIIQATFSSSGLKSVGTEISDNDILEALQRIISERTDYYHQLKQKGIRVPPLQQSEFLASPSRSKKVASK